MHLLRTTVRLCALLATLGSVAGCSDDDNFDDGVGGSQATGGSKAVGGNSNKGGGSSLGGSATAAGGTSAATTATGGASSAGVGNTAQGGASTVTSGGASLGGASPGGATGTDVPSTTGGATSTNTAPIAGTAGVGPAATYTISGTVTGLSSSGTGLSLSLGSGTPLVVSSNGAFAFPTPIPAGSSVAVSVATQPTTPTQTCTVSAAGTIASISKDVTDVAVTCVTQKFSVSGTVTGLAGTGLVLQNMAADDTPIAANGAFSFLTKIDSGKPFTVSVKTQPTNPLQNCLISGGSGTIGASDITTVAVNCSNEAFAIGGIVTGLEGSGLVLQNNLADDVQPTSTGAFAFPTTVATGTQYAVSVKTQPSNPVQNCVVTSGTGTVGSGAVSTVNVACTTVKYKVGGTVTGLSGTGLTLQNNLGDNYPIAASGAFAFPTSIKSNGAYSVSILNQPNSPTQVCTVTPATAAGTVTNADVTNVAINCVTSSFTVGGNVVGLTKAGLVLQNNNGDDLTIPGTGGAFTFATPVLSGSAFSVKVGTQPTGETCSVAGGVGTMGSANVTSVTVNCSDQAHTVSGTVSGLAGSSGVQLSLNDGTPISVTSNGGFSFSTLIAKGGTYAVAVAQQPTSPAQSCFVTKGSGTIADAEITDVTVKCYLDTFSVGGTVSGLAGTGLVLQNNNGADLTIAQNGAFAFPAAVVGGSPYAVTVKTQPSSPKQTCEVVNATGSVSNADVNNIQINCTTNTYKLSGTLSGLAGGSVVLANGTDTLSRNSDGAFEMTKVPSGQPYHLVVQTQPTTPSQTCVVANGDGTMVDADVTNVTVTCTINRFKVGGTLTGLGASKSIVLTNNGGDDLTLSSDGTFEFATTVASGQDYLVAIKTKPAGQECTLSSGTGTLGGSAVTSVLVNCSTQRSLSGTVAGLVGTGLVLKNGSDDLPVSSASFSFPTPYLDGTTYTVEVKTQPTGQTCTVQNATGTFTADVTNVAVTCTANTYAVNVNVAGLAGTGLILQNNAGDNLTVAASGVSTFATKLLSNAGYSVSVLQQPATPAQTCTVTSPTGTIANADVTLAVNCVTNTYAVGGTVYGNVGAGLVLRNNGGNDLAISATGTFVFTTPVASGAPYEVTVGTQPTGIRCAVIAGSGTMGSAAVTSVKVYCPGYTFDTAESSPWFGTYQPPTGSTIAWTGTDGSPTPGALSLYLAYGTGNCPSGSNMSISTTLVQNGPGVNLTGMTSLTVSLKVTDQFPTSNRSGGFQVLMQGSSGFYTGPFVSWYGVTIGQWQQFTFPLTGTTKDLTNITSFGLNIYEGDPTTADPPAACQPMTMLIDSFIVQ